MARWLQTGGQWPWRRLAVFCLTSLLLLQLYSFVRRIHVEVEKMKLGSAIHPSPIQEHEQIEGLKLLPPFGPDKIDLNEEFLNPSSKTRNIFFPMDHAVDPRRDLKRDNLYFRPGRIWLDMDGYPIQAHGGGILLDPISGAYFWYGEYKDGPTYRARETGPARVDVIGVSCYSSRNMWAWKFEGIVLRAEERNEAHDLHKSKVLERPKVIRNEKMGKYVMFMHVDDATYEKASVGIAVSDSPTGPFEYLRGLRPNGFDSRDMTVFEDDNGLAYLVYASVRNKEIHISPLSRDFTSMSNETSRVLVGHHREAPALFKKDGVYYMVTSGCSGWSPNEALVHEAESIFGPWETIGGPCVGANRAFRAATFFSQGAFVVPMPGARSSGWFIFAADRWRPENLRDSRYVWLPMEVRGRRKRNEALPLGSRVRVYWHKKWRLPAGENGESNYEIDLDEW